MLDAFNFRSHVSLLVGNLYALPSQGSMVFKLPSFGLLERTKRSSAFNDFPQFSWSDLTDKEEIGRGSFGWRVSRCEGTSLTTRVRNMFILKGSSNPEIAKILSK